MLKLGREKPNKSRDSQSGSKRVVLCPASVFYSEPWIYSIHYWRDVWRTLPDELS